MFVSDQDWPLTQVWPTPAANENHYSLWFPANVRAFLEATKSPLRENSGTCSVIEPRALLYLQLPAYHIFNPLP